jgi:hypothetical protein
MSPSTTSLYRECGLWFGGKEAISTSVVTGQISSQLTEMISF